jgi:hypothetical protein
MRAIIATDFRGTLRKVFWITENRKGISAGICERAPDPHAIRSLAEQAQLFDSTAFYTHAIMNRLPIFKPNRRIDALLVLGESVFSDIACASFNICLVHRSYEAKFVAGAYSSYEDQSFMVVSVNLFGLHIFSDHQVGVIIYKSKKFPTRGS